MRLFRKKVVGGVGAGARKLVAGCAPRCVPDLRSESDGRAEREAATSDPAGPLARGDRGHDPQGSTRPSQSSFRVSPNLTTWPRTQSRECRRSGVSLLCCDGLANQRETAVLHCSRWPGMSSKSGRNPGGSYPVVTYLFPTLRPSFTSSESQHPSALGFGEPSSSDRLFTARSPSRVRSGSRYAPYVVRQRAPRLERLTVVPARAQQPLLVVHTVIALPHPEALQNQKRP